MSDFLLMVCAVLLAAATLQRIDNPLVDKLQPPAELQQAIEEAAENGFVDDASGN